MLDILETEFYTLSIIPGLFLFLGKKVSNLGNIYAYVRVSSKDQNEDRQVLCMKELQVPEQNIFIDNLKQLLAERSMKL